MGRNEQKSWKTKKTTEQVRTMEHVAFDAIDQAINGYELHLAARLIDEFVENYDGWQESSPLITKAAFASECDCYGNYRKTRHKLSDIFPEDDGDDLPDDEQYAIVGQDGNGNDMVKIGIRSLQKHLIENVRDSALQLATWYINDELYFEKN